MKKTSRLDLGDELIIDKIRSLKLKFDTAFSETEKLTIHSKHIAAIDLTGIQLLHYIHHLAIKEGKEIQFKLQIEGDQQLMLKQCGLYHVIQNQH